MPRYPSILQATESQSHAEQAKPPKRTPKMVVKNFSYSLVNLQANGAQDGATSNPFFIFIAYISAYFSSLFTMIFGPSPSAAPQYDTTIEAFVHRLIPTNRVCFGSACYFFTRDLFMPELAFVSTESDFRITEGFLIRLALEVLMFLLMVQVLYIVVWFYWKMLVLCWRVVYYLLWVPFRGVMRVVSAILGVVLHVLESIVRPVRRS